MKHKNYIKLSKLRSKVATRKRKNSEFLFEFLKKLYLADLHGTPLRDIPGVRIVTD